MKAYKQMQLQKDLELPYDVMCVMGYKKLHIMGDQACLGNEADYSNIDQVRRALEWYVDQFGGKVKWNVVKKV